MLSPPSVTVEQAGVTPGLSGAFMMSECTSLRAGQVEPDAGDASFHVMRSGVGRSRATGRQRSAWGGLDVAGTIEGHDAAACTMRQRATGRDAAGRDGHHVLSPLWGGPTAGHSPVRAVWAAVHAPRVCSEPAHEARASGAGPDAVPGMEIGRAHV